MRQRSTQSGKRCCGISPGKKTTGSCHQLFLDETALALMLMNPQKDDPFAEVVDWLKALRAAVNTAGSGREPAKLLIAARTDVGSIKVSQRKIDRFMAEHEFDAYLSDQRQAR